MHRRELLLAVAGTAAFSGGCLADPGGAGPGSTTVESESSPVRCEGAPIETTKEFSDDLAKLDDIEYLPENESVRYVAVKSGTEPVSYGQIEVSEWLDRELVRSAQERVRSVTKQRVGSAGFGSSVHDAPPDSPRQKAVFLTLTTTWYDGEIVDTPSTEIDALVSAAPRSADVEVTFRGRTERRILPVYAREGKTVLH